MPNIHICGYSKAAAEKIKVRVDTVVQMLGLGGEAVTTIHGEGMVVQSCDSKNTPMPYLHVCGTNPAEVEKIVSMINEAIADVDIEWSIVGGFIPAVRKE